MIIYTFTLIDSSKLLSLLIPMELSNGTFHINHHDIKNGEKSILVIFYCAKVMLLFELGKKKNKMFNQKKGRAVNSGPFFCIFTVDMKNASLIMKNYFYYLLSFFSFNG